MYRYVVISPVRNEEQYIEKTIKSVLSQSVKPVEWMIVNDGSKDKTRQIVEAYARQYHWIKVLNLDDRGFYYAGPGVVDAFYKGFELLSTVDFDYVVKLDGDLSFEGDYFEQILRRFDENGKLGIASGCTVLPSRSYGRDQVQRDRPMGPSKVYRRVCFEAIGGLKRIPGWDTADVLSAQMKGWETQCFFDLPILHFRESGHRRQGITKGKFYLGRMQYRFGYSFVYNCLKALSILKNRPCLIGGLGMVVGYIVAFIRKEEMYFDKEMIDFLKRKHARYVRVRVKSLMAGITNKRTRKAKNPTS